MPFLLRLIRHLTVTPLGAGRKTNSSRLLVSTGPASAVGDALLDTSWRGRWVRSSSESCLGGRADGSWDCVGGATHGRVPATGRRGDSGEVPAGGQGRRPLLVRVVLLLAGLVEVHAAGQTCEEEEEEERRVLSETLGDASSRRC